MNTFTPDERVSIYIYYSLEAPCLGTSKEYPQHFCAEIRKISKRFGQKIYLFWSHE